MDRTGRIVVYGLGMIVDMVTAIELSGRHCLW